MKFFWKYIFPVIFGLVVYTSIRLVNDTSTGEKFWERRWQINAIEIVFVTMLAFCFDQILKYFITKFNRRKNNFSVKNVLQEFGIIFIACFGLLNPFLFFIHYLIQSPVTWKDFVIANIVVGLYVLLYYAITRGNNFIKAYIEQQLKLEKITTDQLQTELKFLKAQYHPHFLFNALNTIYFQMDENVADAKKSIEKFSELLRYQLYDQQQTVAVTQEIHYLENFIELQKVRASEKLKLEVQFDEKLNGQQVYPLLFLPLVENAFKYIGGDYRLSIHAKVMNNVIDFMIENSVPEIMIRKKENGIGLDNLKRRLELLYPQKHELKIEKSTGKFLVNLKLFI